MTIMEQAEKWIAAHRDELVEDILSLVSINSVYKADESDYPYGAGCGEALQWMLHRGADFGFFPVNFGNQVGGLLLREEPVDIGFWGHLDVVPEGDQWAYAPFAPVYKDGFVIGRGAGDNKGPLLALLYVLRCLRELEAPLSKNYALYLGTDEERGMGDLGYFVANHPTPGLSIVPDCGFPVCYAEKGIIDVRLVSRTPLSPSVLELEGGTASNVVPDLATLCLRRTAEVELGLERLPDTVTYTMEGFDRVRLTARGVCGHTAFPGKSVNAIQVLITAVQDALLLPETDLALLYFLARINDDCFGTALHIDCEDAISGRLTCVGSQIRLRQGFVDFGVNIRYPVKADSAALLSSISTTCAQYGYAMEGIRDSKPNFFPLEDPVVDSLMEAYQRVTGRTDKPYAMAGGTYARKLPNALAFGPGLPTDLPEGLVPAGHGGAHAPDEALCVDNLLKAMQVYIAAILNLDALSLPER